VSKYTKHQRQVNRKLENMSKSVRLDIKKYLNRQIKQMSKLDNKHLNRMITEYKRTVAEINGM